ncbi:MAG: ribosome maturation factor RimM [Actinomycetota bacterium]|jgi:16S rRNA processing protein RimM
MPDLLEVGRIGKPHGVRGDTYVTFTSDVEERHSVGSVLVIETPQGRRELVITKSRPEKERFVVHFEGIDDRNDVEKLTNKMLYGAPIDSDDALWVHELIGSTVVDASGATIGTCVSVLQNPAHELLELDNGALVPMPFVLSCADGVTTIDPPEGLFDLND